VIAHMAIIAMAPMNAQALPSTSEDLRAKTRKALRTRQKKSVSVPF
jgi:hypothetical protein